MLIFALSNDKTDGPLPRIIKVQDNESNYRNSLQQ